MENEYFFGDNPNTDLPLGIHVYQHGNITQCKLPYIAIPLHEKYRDVTDNYYELVGYKYQIISVLTAFASQVLYHYYLLLFHYWGPQCHVSNIRNGHVA